MVEGLLSTFSHMYHTGSISPHTSLPAISFCSPCHLPCLSPRHLFPFYFSVTDTSMIPNTCSFLYARIRWIYLEQVICSKSDQVSGPLEDCYFYPVIICLPTLAQIWQNEVDWTWLSTAWLTWRTGLPSTRLHPKDSTALGTNNLSKDWGISFCRDVEVIKYTYICKVLSKIKFCCHLNFL